MSDRYGNWTSSLVDRKAEYGKSAVSVGTEVSIKHQGWVDKLYEAILGCADAYHLQTGKLITKGDLLNTFMACIQDHVTGYFNPESVIEHFKRKWLAEQNKDSSKIATVCRCQLSEALCGVYHDIRRTIGRHPTKEEMRKALEEVMDSFEKEPPDFDP